MVKKGGGMRYCIVIMALMPLLIVSTVFGVFKLGIESIDGALINAYKNDRIGLVTNHTGVDQKHMRSVDILINKGFNIVCLMAPEHGITGKVLAGKVVMDTIDLTTKIPVFSLYGNGEGKEISDELFSGVDTIMFDMQDSGMRHYTYISTLFKVMQAAARTKKRLVVFDRPNPLGGIMEGPLVEPEYRSFISIASIPLRHGMTIGELARYFNKYECDVPVNVHIVPMKNYNRAMTALHSLLTPLSPNIKSIESCYGYSFLGLLGEIEPFDIGIGTMRAFRCFGLPAHYIIKKVDWQKLQKILRVYHVHSDIIHYHKKNKKMIGLQLYITDIHKVNGLSALCAIIDFVCMHNVPIVFKPIFNKAAGSSLLASILEKKVDRVVASKYIDNQLMVFKKKIAPCCLYTPLPEGISIKYNT